MKPRFNDLPTECTDELSSACRRSIEKLREIGAYVDKWLQFQSLWDLQSEQVYHSPRRRALEMAADAPGDPEGATDLRHDRGDAARSDISRSSYDQVQTKVNSKYDQWQHDILLKFAGRLGNRMRDIHADDREGAPGPRGPGDGRQLDRPGRSVHHDRAELQAPGQGVGSRS